MTEVRLVDLDIIKRFSLAVRRDTVPADELLASLDASRAVVVAALDGEQADSSANRPAKTSPVKRPAKVAASAGKGSAAKRSAATGSAAKRSAAKRAPAKAPPAPRSATGRRDGTA